RTLASRATQGRHCFTWVTGCRSGCEVSATGSLLGLGAAADVAGDRDAEFAYLGAQAAAGDAEDAGRLDLVAPRLPQDARQQQPLHAPQRLLVGVLRTRLQPFLDELLQGWRVVWSEVRTPHALRDGGQPVGQEHGASGPQQGLLEHA